MTEITHPEILSLKSSLYALRSTLQDKKNSTYNKNLQLIITLDQIQSSVLALRKLMQSQQYEFADQLFELYKDSFLPLLHHDFLKKNDYVNRGGVQWHFYNTLSCVSSLFADVMDVVKWTLDNNPNTLIVVDKIASLVHDYHYLEWTEEHIKTVQYDLEHLAGADHAKINYKDNALVRKAMYALLLECTEEKANALISRLNKIMCKRAFRDLVESRKSNISVYLQLVCLMRHCMQNLPQGEIGAKINSVYAEILVSILLRLNWPDDLIYAELKNTLDYKSGLSDAAAKKVRNYIESYEKTPTGYAKLFVKDPEVDNVCRAQIKLKSKRYCEEDVAFAKLHLNAMAASTARSGIFSRNRMDESTSPSPPRARNA